MIRLLPAEMAVNPKKSAKSVLLMIRLFSKNPFKRSCYENTIGLLRIAVEKQVFISNRYRCTTRNTYRPLRGRSQTTFIRQGRSLELVSKKLNHFGVIAGLFRQIGGHSSRFVLFCSF